MIDRFLFREINDVPETARGERGTSDIYVKDGDVLTWVPPEWTMRGYLEQNDFPMMRKGYDLSVSAQQVAADDAEFAKADEETKRFVVPLANGILGRTVEIQTVLFFIYVCTHPKMRMQGLMGQYLNNLSHNQTIVFSEVLPESGMMGMLRRRGFRPMHVADRTDSLNIFYPCFVRFPKVTKG